MKQLHIPRKFDETIFLGYVWIMKRTPNRTKDDQLRCPSCSSPYQSQNIHTILQEKGRRILHVSCMQCNTSLFLSLEAQSFGIAGVGVPTDLSYIEAIQQAKNEPITSDIVLAVYRSLQKGEKSFFQEKLSDM